MNRPKDPQQDIINFIDDPNTIKKAVEGSMDKRLKVLAKAELRLKIADWVDDYAETLLGSEYSGKINREECLDGLLELFQAHQQELLSELKKELPRKQKLVLRQTKLTDYQLGYNAAHKEVVSVIERYISQTKDSDIPETNVYQDDREGN